MIADILLFVMVNKIYVPYRIPRLCLVILHNFLKNGQIHHYGMQAESTLLCRASKEEGKKKGNNEALLHNLSRSGHLRPQVAFFQMIITG